jgi:hypothetical protein
VLATNSVEQEKRAVIPDRTCENEKPESKHTREDTMDKTLADSYPASDPPSTIPDPSVDQDEAGEDV